MDDVSMTCTLLQIISNAYYYDFITLLKSKFIFNLYILPFQKVCVICYLQRDVTLPSYQSNWQRTRTISTEPRSNVLDKTLTDIL